jgi:hypothetical protein
MQNTFLSSLKGTTGVDCMRARARKGTRNVLDDDQQWIENVLYGRDPFFGGPFFVQILCDEFQFAFSKVSFSAGNTFTFTKRFSIMKGANKWQI